MSAAGRGAERRADDAYATPSWCVRRLLEAVDLPAGHWLEPCAGDGAIIRAASVKPGLLWTACELRPEMEVQLRELTQDVRIGDVLAGPPPYLMGAPSNTRSFAACVTNPPYSLAQECIEMAMECADHVVMLLRLNYLASIERSAFMRTYPPDVYVLPNRPSFTGGRTDATEYCWMHWPPPDRRRPHGRVSVLAPTPIDMRKWG